MTVKIIGLIVGLLVLGAGLYYLVKEKKDPESRKNYGVVSAVGKNPGPTALQVMPRADHSWAMARVSCTTPPLPAP